MYIHIRVYLNSPTQPPIPTKPQPQVQDRWGLKVPAQMTLRTYASEDGGRAAAMLYLAPGTFMCVLWM